MKAIKLSLPYPSLDGITKDVKSGCIIASAYASSHSELSAILGYTYHGFFMKECGEDETQKILGGIAVCEMEHLHILGTLLLKLGIDPVFAYPYRYNYYKADSINYSNNPQKMLMDDITGELLAIEGYNNILNNLKNEEVASIIERIKLDEELHVKILKERLDLLIEKRKRERDNI